MLKLPARALRITLFLIILCVSVSFVIGNQNPITLSLPPTSVSITVYSYLYAAFFFVLGLMGGIFTCILHYSRIIRRLNRKIRTLTVDKNAYEQEFKTKQIEQDALLHLKNQLSQRNVEFPDATRPY